MTTKTSVSDELPLAVVYYRCSTDKQDTSIGQQREVVVPWCHDRYVLAEEYVDEGRSGSKDTGKRTDFLRMIRDLTAGKYKGKVKIVVCLNLDRFGRLDTLAGAEHKQMLREAGVRLDTPIDGTIDWNRSIDRIVDSVKSEAAHGVALTIGEKGLRGRIRVTRAGRPNQTTPYGLAKEVTSPTGEKTIIPRGQPWATPKTWQSHFVPGDPAEADAVRLLFKLFAEEDISYNQIAARLTEKGYASPTGIGWHGQMVRCMLRNPVYAGDLAIGLKPKGRFFRAIAGKETPATESATCQPHVTRDAHEGLVSRELWELVQAKITRVTKRRGRPRKAGPYPLTGVVHCGTCGTPMYGFRDDKGRNAYRCHRVEVGPSSCSYWIAYEPLILPHVIGRVLPDLLAEAERLALHAAREAVAGQEEEHARLVQQRAQLDKKLGPARERFLEAPAEVAAGLLETLQRWEAERRELDARIAARPQARPLDRLRRWVEEVLKEVGIGVRVRLDPRNAAALDQRSRVDFMLVDLADWALAGLPRECEKALEVESGLVAVVNTPAALPVAVLREKFKQLGLRIDVWFRRKAKGRGYDLDKVRVRANLDESLCYEWSSKADS